jgi:hypothetical protein
MKNRLVLLIPFLFIMLSVFAAADGQFFASNATVSCVGGWKSYGVNATDNNFNSRDTTPSDNAGSCNFMFPSTPGFQNATLFSRSSTDAAYASTVPSTCYYKGRINITVTSSYDSSANSIFIRCNNGTGSQDITANGAGDSVSNKDDFYELYLNVSFTGVADCPPQPNPPMYRKDDFSYSDAIQDCFWSAHTGSQLEPDIFPTSGELCYNVPISQEPAYLFFSRANNVKSSVWSEEFDIKLTNASSFISHDLILTNENLEGYSALTLLFDGADIYMALSNYSIGRVCDNCTVTGVPNHIKVVVYTASSSGELILNSTSGQMQGVKPNTYAVSVDGGDWVFNIPLALDSSKYYIPYTTEFLDSVYGFCLDNYELYGGVTYIPGINQTGAAPPNSLTIGERCETNEQCISQFCNFMRICDLKGFAESCVNNFECLSQDCSFGKCTKASAYQTATKIKNEAVGNDEQSSDIISLIICIVLAVGMVILASVVGAAGGVAVIAGGAVFTIMLIFFTVISWLNPFFLVGYLILLAVIGFILISPRN